MVCKCNIISKVQDEYLLLVAKCKSAPLYSFYVEFLTCVPLHINYRGRKLVKIIFLIFSLNILLIKMLYQEYLSLRFASPAFSSCIFFLWWVTCRQQICSSRRRRVVQMIMHRNVVWISLFLCIFSRATFWVAQRDVYAINLDPFGWESLTICKQLGPVLCHSPTAKGSHLLFILDF